MATPDWLRTFVAIYRSGSVSAGSAARGLSQSAGSQQLAALERRVGRPLFSRTPKGVEPTGRGSELYAQVADSLDRLELVLAGLDVGVVPAAEPPLRVGSSAEYFATEVVPRLGPGTPPVRARFGSDPELVGWLEQGELDVAVTSVSPPRRALATTPVGAKRFSLVGPPGSRPDPAPGSLADLGALLTGTPWVAYSAELPLTRRFWQSALGRPFAGRLRLVAPDLRAVVGAVEHGVGVSLLPDFACAVALSRGTVVELFPVGEVVPAEPWLAATRTADVGRADLAAFVAGLAGPRPDGPGSAGGPGRAVAPDTPGGPLRQAATGVSARP